VSALSFRLATVLDTDIVLAILNDAAAWLAERQIAGWEVGQWTRTSIEAAIGRGETYLAHDREREVGTLNLQWSDQVFWPDAPADGGYVHRLAVARHAHGRSVGRELLSFAERIAREHGKRYLRLDCPCGNEGLRAYYLAAGFGWRGDREFATGTRPWCGSRFEKQL